MAQSPELMGDIKTLYRIGLQAFGKILLTTLVSFR